ncbi:FecR family protein [Pedobacter sp. BMA]|uniref:FecR family protein n=1 Tax=Pedobacter sp. BMA TaxID=1663685 RepID=UPI0006498625|nr:FecR family protein [Pedobacter sp. BMA]KLT67068.1 hypothetical protein AB669_03970 [Pedobacter sp. BMA]
MKQLNLQQLIDKYSNGTCSPEELEVVENLYLQWKVQPQEISETELASVKAEVWSGVSKEFKPVHVVSIWKKIGLAAAILIFIFSVGILLVKWGSDHDAQINRYANDVPPGHKGATLTLADGRKIKLANVAYEVLDRSSGLNIKAANGKIIYTYSGNNEITKGTHTLSTGEGETYQIILPDGSLAWLNAASSLTFSTQLGKSPLRKVFLRGEGYFEVKKDKSRPFFVESKAQRVEVLGTHFNVRSYNDDNSTKTTLIEGTVHVSPLNSTNKGITLKPNQQAVNTKDGISSKLVDVSEVVDWKNDGFAFNGENFDESMRRIGRWYQVEIIYDPHFSKDVEIGGFISRTNSLATVLKFIESTGKVHFKIEGRRVFVTN